MSHSTATLPPVQRNPLPVWVCKNGLGLGLQASCSKPRPVQGQVALTGGPVQGCAW